MSSRNLTQGGALSMQGKRAIKKSLNLQFDGRFIGKLAFY